MSDTTSSENLIAAIALNDPYTGIENRLVRLDYDPIGDGSLSISGTFLYFTFKGKSPSVSEFVDFIYPKIVPFCIPKKKRDELSKKFVETNDPRYVIELVDQAKNLFIKAKRTLKRGGEPGELILFSVLEHYFRAPQIASKMFLKTSEAMPVHGTDGIHIKYDENNKKLYLYWGESKLYQNLSSSFDEVCSSLLGFVRNNSGRSPRERDIDILKDHSAITDDKTKEAILEYFDPYSKKSNDLREVYCCLSGFDYSLYNNMGSLSEDDIDEYFKAEYLKRIATACDLFIEKITAHELHNLSFNLILLPFESVKEFRRLFYAKLGLSMEEIEDDTDE